MYLYFGIFFLILLLFFVINFWRRRRIIRKIRNLCMDEKCLILDELIQPFGYSYILSQDVFSTRIDAWQREFGYCDFYDRAAPHFNMIFDSLPIYFNYNDRTWMIELWKGQYGINTGCEIGVYYADRILEENELKSTLFQCVDDKDMPRLSFTLLKNGESVARLRQHHWWLTAFSMGCFSKPADLTLYATLTFPSFDMADAFAVGLMDAGYSRRDIRICCDTVSFTFAESTPASGFFRRLRIRLAQFFNRFWCRVYLSVTKPFVLSIDRLLYLYYFLPFAFRRMFRIRRYQKIRNQRG